MVAVFVSDDIQLDGAAVRALVDKMGEVVSEAVQPKPAVVEASAPKPDITDRFPRGYGHGAGDDPE